MKLIVYCISVKSPVWILYNLHSQKKKGGFFFNLVTSREFQRLYGMKIEPNRVRQYDLLQRLSLSQHTRQHLAQQWQEITLSAWVWWKGFLKIFLTVLSMPWETLFERNGELFQHWQELGNVKTRAASCVWFKKWQFYAHENCLLFPQQKCACGMGSLGNHQ